MHIRTSFLISAGFAATVALASSDRSVSLALFTDLEEASRLADIAYCVGVSGIWAPFGCLSRCSDFPGFELVDTWNTGPLLSDSCGYIALDHPKKRIVVAFRGTYSIASALADLATTPQEYVPYPDPENPAPPTSKQPQGGWFDWIPWRGRAAEENIITARDDGVREGVRSECTNCTVHAGFLASWIHTRSEVLPHLARLGSAMPDYEVHLIGHSLGGAVAALAGLELRGQDRDVVVTTFGEPRIGNKGLVEYVDAVFGLGEGETGGGFRRVTHVDDPVPLLPLQEWGYRMHGGESYISKSGLPVGLEDVEKCVGDEDRRCIAGADAEALDKEAVVAFEVEKTEAVLEEANTTKWGLASRYRIWQLLFAHRDYFWRVGLCVPGGDPAGWGRGGGWYGRGEKESNESDGEVVDVEEL